MSRRVLDYPFRHPAANCIEPAKEVSGLGFREKSLQRSLAAIGRLFVTFAEQDEDKEDEVHGPGLGFVDEFDAGGHLLLRLRSGSWMNAPWGVVAAPANFFSPRQLGIGISNTLLVGQFGSGQIAMFDLKSGNFHGLLPNPSGQPLTIDGLWALSFGNGAAAGPTNTLFFTAGIDDEMHGLFGTITPIAGP